MWPSNKDIPLFIRVPIIMNHHLDALSDLSVDNLAKLYHDVLTATVRLWQFVTGPCPGGSMQTVELLDDVQGSWKDDSGGVDLITIEKFGFKGDASIVRREEQLLAKWDDASKGDTRSLWLTFKSALGEASTLCLKKMTMTFHTITSMHINRFW